MTTINREIFRKDTSYFGCSRDCNNLRIAVKLEFDCTHPNQAFTFVKKCIKGQDNYQVRFNSNDNICEVLLFPDGITLPSENDLE